MLRLLSIGLAVSVLAVACGSSGSSHTASTNGATTTAGGPASGSVHGTGSPGSTIPGATPGATLPGGAPVTTGATAPGATVTTAADTAPARTTLDAYLAAFSALDRPKLASTSINAALALGQVLGTVSDVNNQAGGHTTNTLTGEQFAPADATPNRVTFNGSVTINVEIKGSKGDQKSTDTISGPLQVTNTAAGWRVVAFTYNGRPLVYVNEQANQTVSGVELGIGFVLTYGSLSAATVAVGSGSGPTNVHLTATTITAGGAAPVKGSGAFANGPRVTGIFLYPRLADTPSHLTANFDRSDGSKLAFSMDLHGQPS